MKKIIMLLISVSVSISIYAQDRPSQDTLRLKHFSTWAIAPYLSAPFQYTDIEPISLSSKKPAFGINLEKHLSHYTSVQLGYFNASMNNPKDGLDYKMDISQWDARFYLHLTNGNTLRTWRSTQLYTYVGIGRLNHKSTITDEVTLKEINEINANAVVFQVGAGAKYRLGNRTSLFVDGCANFTDSDRIDAKLVPYTNNDGYFKASVGLSYTFGKKRTIEWDNPYQYLVPETIHDTTVVIKTIKYIAPDKPEVIWPDSAVIYYIPKSFSIEIPYLAQLDSVIDNAIANNLYNQLQVSAYCDTMGSDKTNQVLVLKRANAVVNYINQKIAENTGNVIINTISIILHDESEAVYAPDARNRKVVVKIKK